MGDDKRPTRGLAILESQGIDIETSGVVPLRDHRDPIRTEAEAWRAILDDRRARGIPISLEEFEEARAVGAEA